MHVKNKKLITVIRNVVIVIPLLFIYVMLLLHLSLPVKTYSKEEHRYLAQWPVFHTEGIADGSYKTKIENYFSDQFPFRNFWVNIQDASNQIVLNKIN
jgi:hypothetical protein